ncbi:LutB/LldF family L-lactate oxidation iron-sulfur protein [Alicyclobacillus fastidiosus]|uniref:LutB/LldF family L-lactate oxidation iron-sulfur protein n=1 Tax=Alicyclobacillus fastidiosus TaxID=392011 RepID=A0ABY6ZNA8_9BACL|nr:LutB/LldF family L-lactate oxidation iron-sulfur protein [Alicyclobacillus fastidiosus]WAH44320.1 LutB/LldF family L-lactate oxidation iron-sulfur protein [Alicyclobacillus fastidiosus]GMA60647.1 iron-sulfur cluster-binding protein [Alicyclobacillus fastidiosus]
MTADTKTAAGVLDRAQIAMKDEFLRKAVRFTTDRLRNKKQTVTESFGNWEAWRERGEAIRAHTIANLDVYLSQFAEKLEALGATVHFAANSAEAVGAVQAIVREKDAHKVVKSKSMVSEEIHINHHLEQMGVGVVETDLGEYIIQLANEAPSHIIIPAIHKNREQIRDLFAAAGAKHLSTETRDLTAFARQRLRAEFLSADIGITGCNFGIADTGSIVLFTNEGNADMVMNLPKTHIVIMGMERVLPTLADLEVMAHLLPKSATGQNVITYMSMVTGPKHAEDGDGASDMHVIILDNGRSKQLGDPQFQSILNCIRCGACLNVCPVYRQIGGHAYGSVYPGPIGAVLSPLLNDGEEFRDLPYASSLCGACYEACPVRIPLHDMLVHQRQRQVANGHGKRMERLAFQGYKKVFGRSSHYRFAIRLARSFQNPLVKDGKIKAKIGPLAGWTASRDFPKVPKKSFRDLWPKLTEGGSQR